MSIKKVLKVFLNILFYLILAFMIYTSFNVVSATKRNEQPEIFGFKFYVVLTGSMQPEIRPGDLVIIKDINPADITTGDVITFKNENSDSVTTHRVKEITKSDDTVSFITQGDANNIEDKIPVKGENIQGKLVKVVPDAGRTVSFMKKNVVVILAVIVAVFALIAVLLTIIRGLKKKEIKRS